jgi:methylmalonyl-CoA mutase
VLYPFVKKRPIKTLIRPLTRKRISESLEKERLLSEKEEVTSKNE